MSDIPSFPYASLWGERQLRSVANLTRRDGAEFMEIAAATRIETRIRTYPLAGANAALDDLRSGVINGTAVLICESAAEATAQSRLWLAEEGYALRRWMQTLE